MTLLNRSAIDAAQGHDATIDVDVPEWNGSVRLRRMTVDEIVALLLQGKHAENGNRSALLFHVVSCCAIDESGAQLWPTEADVRALPGKRSLDAIQRLFEAAMQLNQLTEDPEKN